MFPSYGELKVIKRIPDPAHTWDPTLPPPERMANGAPWPGVDIGLSRGHMTLFVHGAPGRPYQIGAEALHGYPSRSIHESSLDYAATRFFPMENVNTAKSYLLAELIRFFEQKGGSFEVYNGRKTLFRSR